jgi:sulfoxide reductase heme-binding subunit YedZ
MAAERRRRTWALVLVGVAAVALAGVLLAGQPFGTALHFVVRASAILGYEAVFLAAVSSSYMSQMMRLFGRSFLKVHHVLSLSGLVLITLHPLGLAIEASSLSLLVPRFESLEVFLRLGGRPAWFLFGLTALTAALRWPARRGWRVLHLLNYVGFALATAHALMIGGDFQSPLARLVTIVFAVVAVLAFARRRLGKR